MSSQVIAVVRSVDAATKPKLKRREADCRLCFCIALSFFLTGSQTTRNHWSKKLQSTMLRNAGRNTERVTQRDTGIRSIASDAKRRATKSINAPTKDERDLVEKGLSGTEMTVMSILISPALNQRSSISVLVRLSLTSYLL